MGESALESKDFWKMIRHRIYIWLVVLEINGLYRDYHANYGMTHLAHGFWHFWTLAKDEGDVSKYRQPIKLTYLYRQLSRRFFDFLRMKSRIKIFPKIIKLRMVLISLIWGGWPGIMTLSLENATLVPGWNIGFFGT